MTAAVVATAIAVAAAFLLLLRALRHGLRGLAASWRRLAEHDLVDLFIVVDPRRLLAGVGIAVTATLLVGYWLGAGPVALSGLGIAVAAAPTLAVRGLHRRRQRRLQAQLPDLLTLWAGLLRSGRGVMPALAELAANQPDPMGQELRLVLRRCRVGETVDAAIAELTRRVPDPDLVLLATTLRLSRELGGNLAEALQRLSATLRERLLMESRIGALTAQGRLQGILLGLLPLLLLGVLLTMQPALGRLLRDSPLGWAALAVIAMLELLGYVSIRRIVSIRV